MKRRTLLLSLPALALLPAGAFAQAISLAELSNYFNSFSTARTQFTQINPDGTIATGTLYIQRPGRMRFEYDPPDNNLVLAAGGTVAIFDAKSNQGPTQYPLSRTPLNLILAPRVDLSRDRMVVAHRQEDNTTVVVAQDPEHPEYGNIRLVFTAGPTELRQWRVTDDSGRETTVILGGLETGVQLSQRLFNIVHETEDRQR
jgi:outer membrane lipoprotein-sorting protein